MNSIPPRRLVERFYHELWNLGDEAVANEILHRDLCFRGSLGRERRGPEGFLDYMRAVRPALGRYECIIDDLIEGDLRAAARMRFKGIHNGEFFGVPATGREIVWTGAAFFTTNGRQIIELWVLGDIGAVMRQLGAGSAAPFAHK
jgi:predicted ester cyclase